MSRFPQTRKDHVDALRLRLLSCLSEADAWSGSFDEGDEFVAKMIEARIAVQEAVLLVGEAQEIMRDE